jgi:hypothetical protein
MTINCPFEPFSSNVNQVHIDGKAHVNGQIRARVNVNVNVNVNVK